MLLLWWEGGGEGGSSGGGEEKVVDSVKPKTSVGLISSFKGERATSLVAPGAFQDVRRFVGRVRQAGRGALPRRAQQNKVVQPPSLLLGPSVFSRSVYLWAKGRRAVAVAGGGGLF